LPIWLALLFAEHAFACDLFTPRRRAPQLKALTNRQSRNLEWGAAAQNVVDPNLPAGGFRLDPQPHSNRIEQENAPARSLLSLEVRRVGLVARMCELDAVGATGHDSRKNDRRGLGERTTIDADTRTFGHRNDFEGRRLRSSSEPRADRDGDGEPEEDHPNG